MASWIFGEHFSDPHAAQKAIESLVQERDAIQLQIKETQTLIESQRQMVEEAEQALKAAQAASDVAVSASKERMAVIQDKELEIVSVRRRLAAITNLFSLQKEAQAISAGIANTRETILPSPLVVSGPSAAGKATLITKLFEEMGDDFAVPITHTTRPAEAGEEDGVHFYFTTRKEMEQAITEGKFLEVAEVDGHLYGTTAAAVAQVRNEGKVCVLHLDLAGVEQLRGSHLTPVCVWVTPPSLEALKERLRRRGADSEEELQTRLEQAGREMERAERKGADLFDYFLVNDDVQSAYKALKTVLRRYPHLEARMAAEGA